MSPRTWNFRILNRVGRNHSRIGTRFLSPLWRGFPAGGSPSSLPILYDYELQSQHTRPGFSISTFAVRGYCSMRVLVCFSALILSVAFPVLLHAQFQEPTKEELAMTEDPKAPGAAAVYLNLEEITDDPLHYHSFYARIKVLQEKGKELATVELPYQRGDFKVTDIHGRTIHADGTVIPLTGKPEDLLISKGADKTFGR